MYHNHDDYDRLRFQLEFNFRDAKQYWGLEDFITVNETPVYNSANLAMFMVNVRCLDAPDAHALAGGKCERPASRALNKKYVVETLKLLPEMPDPIFIDQAIAQVARLGRVNHVVNPL